MKTVDQYDVFISYSSQDEEKALSIRNHLQSKGMDCWMAPESIEPGLDYSEVIPDAIDGSKIILLLVSYNSQKSVWVPKELSYALSNRKRVLPYKISPCDLLKKFSFYLSDVQVIEYQNDIQSLYRKITSIIANKTTQEYKTINDQPTSRKTFTWEKRAPYAVFNSITNNPEFGDERKFVGIRKITNGACTPVSVSTAPYVESINIEKASTYEVRIYYHNNSDPKTVGKKAIGIADGAGIRSYFPSILKAEKKDSISATIMAGDTEPTEVSSSVKIIAESDCYLRYIPGTAVFHNKGELNGKSVGPKYLFGVGSLIGFNKLSGLIPGGEEYAGFITYRLFSDYPDFEVSLSAKKQNSSNIYLVKVHYKNTGTMNQNNVVIKAIIEPGMTYLAGSSVLSNNNLNRKKINDDVAFELGVNIGDYAGGSGWAELEYLIMVENPAFNNVFEAIISTNDGNKRATTNALERNTML